MIEEKCLNCNNLTSEKYCSNCGCRTVVERIDAKYAKDELLQLVGYEKGIVYTFRRLLVAPGNTINEYLNGSRSALAKPVTFLLVASVFYTLVASYAKTESVYEQQLRNAYEGSSAMLVMQWIQDNYGYANLVMMLAIALFVRLFFSKRAYNIFEILAMLCFAMGEGMILLSATPLQAKFLGLAWAENIIYGAVMCYIAWAIGQFFGGRFKDYVKAFAAYGAGFIVFNVIALLLAVVYDVMRIGK